MALQGKITATRPLQGAGMKQKEIVAKNISVSTFTTQLSTLTDVDISARVDGSIIQYDAPSSTFKVKPVMEDTNSNTKINGGTF